MAALLFWRITRTNHFGHNKISDIFIASSRYMNKNLFQRIDIIIAGVIGFIVILILTYPHGVGISPDSIDYTGAARNIISAHRIYSFDGDSLVEFPAGYPLFLAALSFLSGHDIIQIAPFVNAVLFGLLVFFCGVIIEKFTVISKWLKWISLFLIITCVAILRVYFMLWSETLFILLTIVFFLVFYKYLQSHSYNDLVVAALIVALSCITRYAGITLIGTACFLIVCDSRLKLRRKAIQLMLFGSISISLLVINLWRNYLISGTLTGNRKPSVTPFADNIYYCGKAVVGWLSPLNEDTDIAFALGFIVMTAVFIFVIVFLIRKIFSKSFHSIETVAVTFSFVYAAFMVVSATFSRYEQIDYRLMSPLFIPLTLSIGSSVAEGIKNLQHRNKKWLLGGALLIAALFEVSQIRAFYTLPNQDTYSDSEWRNSSIVNFLKQNKNFFQNGYAVASNSHYAIYFYTGLVAKPLPDIEDASAVDGLYKEHHMYLVWFTKDESDEMLSLDTILKNKSMTLLKKFDDGFIYQYE